MPFRTEPLELSKWFHLRSHALHPGKTAGIISSSIFLVTDPRATGFCVFKPLITVLRRGFDHYLPALSLIQGHSVPWPQAPSHVLSLISLSFIFLPLIAFTTYPTWNQPLRATVTFSPPSLSAAASSEYHYQVCARPSRPFSQGLAGPP